MHDLILKNFWLKLASLVLATLIWLTVRASLDKESGITNTFSRLVDESDGSMTSGRRIEHRFEVPVRVQSNGTNLLSYRPVPSKVSVTVTSTGGSAQFSKLGPRDLDVFVEVGDIPNVHDLYPVQVTPPPHFAWQRVLPFAIKVMPVRESRGLPVPAPFAPPSPGARP